MSQVSGLLGRKLGMTGIFNEKGEYIGVTVVEVLPNVIIDKVLDENKNIKRVRLGYGERKLKRTSKAMKVIFARAKTTPKLKIAEFDWLDGDCDYGKVIRVEEVFNEGERIKIQGYSKGRGFQGVVKRHGFAGVGFRTHGQHNRERAPGSLGSSTYPARLWKGKRMPGHMGMEKVTIHNIQIVKILPEKNILLLHGSVPGNKYSFVKLLKYQD